MDVDKTCGAQHGMDIVSDNSAGTTKNERIAKYMQSMLVDVDEIHQAYVSERVGSVFATRTKSAMNK